MHRRTLAVVVTALGVVGVAAAFAIEFRDINDWALVFFQFGLGYVAIGAVAGLDRRGHRFGPRLEALVLALPVVVPAAIVGASLTIEGVSFGLFLYPWLLEDKLYLIWLASSSAVPLAFGLARTHDRKVEWALSGLGLILVTASFLYVTDWRGIGDNRVQYQWAPTIFIIGLSLWLSIPAYRLGKKSPRPSEERDSLVTPARVFSAAVSALLLVAFWAAGLANGPVLENLLSLSVMIGPVLYFGTHAMWTTVA